MTDANRYGPWAVVAGASEGIGEHAARQLAADGISVLLVSRRQDALHALQESTLTTDAAPDVEVLTLALDLAADDAAELLDAATDGLDVGLLFYNAGADTACTPFLDRSLDQVLALPRINVITATAVCHRFGRRLRDRGRGGIVIISSGAAASGSAGTATYAASKSYQLNLAEGLWAELDGTGVDVVCVLAGMTITPSLLRHTAITADDPRAMDSADVARKALASLGSGPVVGASDQIMAMIDAMRSMPRTERIAAVSKGTRASFGLD